MHHSNVFSRSVLSWSGVSIHFPVRSAPFIDVESKSPMMISGFLPEPINLSAAPSVQIIVPDLFKYFFAMG